MTAGRWTTQAAAPNLGRMTHATIRCQHLLPELEHEKGTRLLLPHHKIIWTCADDGIIRHHASFPAALQVCTALATKSRGRLCLWYLWSQAFGWSEPLPDRQKRLPWSLRTAVALSLRFATEEFRGFFKRRVFRIAPKPEVMITRPFLYQSCAFGKRGHL